MVSHGAWSPCLLAAGTERRPSIAWRPHVRRREPELRRRWSAPEARHSLGW